MLFKRDILEGIAAGRVTLAFRRWRRPSVRPGGTLRTARGVVAIESVTPVQASDIAGHEALAAGHASREHLMRSLAAGSSLPIYRIGLRLLGEDPRLALRAEAALSGDDLAEIDRRLARLDCASPRAPWTDATLQMIARRPEIRASDLAATLGRDTAAFKREVRKLKELGLTESLDVGYRLSPRGEAFLAWQRAP